MSSEDVCVFLCLNVYRLTSFLFFLGPPKKSFWIILRLVFFFFAIEYMYAVETALTIPIFSLLRVDESYVISRKEEHLNFVAFYFFRLFSFAWLISPILGFFLQPIIGMWSDTCKCRWGRRRPFILAFAIGRFLCEKNPHQAERFSFQVLLSV